MEGDEAQYVTVYVRGGTAKTWMVAVGLCLDRLVRIWLCWHKWIVAGDGGYRRALWASTISVSRVEEEKNQHIKMHKRRFEKQGFDSKSTILESRLQNTSGIKNHPEF
jgi:hypothetical protein